MGKFKKTKEYLVLSGLFLININLLVSATKTIKDYYYIDISSFTVLISWIAIACLLMAVINFVIEYSRVVYVFLKDFIDYAKK